VAKTAYWNDRAVTQKSYAPAVVPALASIWMFVVLGAPARAVPVAGAQQVVLKLLQGMVWLAEVIAAQYCVPATVTCTRAVAPPVGRLLNVTDTPDPVSCTGTLVVSVVCGDRLKPKPDPQTVKLGGFCAPTVPAAQRLFGNMQMDEPFPSANAKLRPL
jgi:hypothetical protein